jgi:hypothetical protein
MNLKKIIVVYFPINFLFINFLFINFLIAMIRNLVSILLESRLSFEY